MEWTQRNSRKRTKARGCWGGGGVSSADKGILKTSGGAGREFEIVCRHEPEQRKLIKRVDEAFLNIWGRWIESSIT